ncbi:MAG: flavodoxin family protein [Actinobacteria bacterium]|nr:flavodoxin family protein [Actinomycetota bacterium]
MAEVIKNKKQYKVAAVYGSPRRGGNTDVLLNKFLQGLSECDCFKESADEPLELNIDKIHVSELAISSCRECRSCSKNGLCVVNDDMQKVYPYVEECDLLIIASPVFFTTVSGHLKAFIDRFQRFWALKYEIGRRTITKENKKGILLSCAGSKPENIFDCTKKVIRALFDVLYIKYYADFCYNNIDFMGDILKEKEIIDAIYEFGKKGEFIKEGI